MTTSHIFYIPLVLLIGLVLGVLLGRRSVAVAAQEEERRRARRAARRERARDSEAESSAPGDGAAAP